MRKLFIYSILFIFCGGISINLYAQNTTEHSIKKSTTNPISKNIVKVSLGNFIFKNYGVQYERILAKHWSAVLGIRAMPSTTIPFKDLVSGDMDTDMKDKLDVLRLSNIAITPEFRFYVSKKGIGKGFYIAPYYRYTGFKLSNFITESATTGTTTPAQVSLTGIADSHSFGLMLGSQFFLSKRMVLDWWILGAHKGNGKANLSGNSSRPLTTQEQADIRKDLQDSNGSDFSNSDIYVDANTVRYNFGTPWLGLRVGLSLGIKF